MVLQTGLSILLLLLSHFPEHFFLRHPQSYQSDNTKLRVACLFRERRTFNFEASIHINHHWLFCSAGPTVYVTVERCHDKTIINHSVTDAERILLIGGFLQASFTVTFDSRPKYHGALCKINLLAVKVRMTPVPTFHHATSTT